MSGALTSLLEELGEISDLAHVAALMRWDERTMMPPRGGGARAQQLATIVRVAHERFASDEIGDLLEQVEAGLDGAPPDSFEASLARITRRDWDKARRVPAELEAEIALACSHSEHAWEQARPASDFAAVLPHLERVISLKREYIGCFDVEHPYDALLDDYEPGVRTAQIRPVLAELRAGAIALLERLDPHLGAVDASFLW